MRHLLTRTLLVLLMLLLGGPEAAGQYFAFGKNRVQYQRLDWQVLRSPRFDVHYDEPGGRALAVFAARTAEAALLELEPLFGHALSRRVPLIVFQSHADFAATTAIELPVYAEGIGGVTEAGRNRVAVPFTGDWRAFARVIRHELVHALMNDLLADGAFSNALQRGLQFRIPSWVAEGLAEYGAVGWDTESDRYVREALVAGHMPPAYALRGYLAYRAAPSVWDYIAQEYGREKIGEIMIRLRDARSVEAAIFSATGLETETLSRRWQAALRATHFPETAVREDIDAFARRPASPGRRAYMASPALSPSGEFVAYLAASEGLFNVYLARADGSDEPRLLVQGQTTPAFESLRILTPGLAWSPDGRQLALAVRSGPTNGVALISVETGGSHIIPVRGVSAVLSVDWSLDGDRIALSATSGAASNIYVLDLPSGRVQNLTRDVFSDHAPVWSPDGEAILFHSDRGDNTTTGVYRADEGPLADAAATDFRTRYDPHGQGVAPYDIYRIQVADPMTAKRLTFGPVGDNTDAQVSEDGDIFFISDRNGVPNLYLLGESGSEQPLTDLLHGISALTIDAEGRTAGVLALRDGLPAVYLIDEPVLRTQPADPLTPTVWALRRDGPTPWQGSVSPPALAVAPEVLARTNPFLRSVDPVSIQRALVAEDDTTDSTRYGGFVVDFDGEADTLDTPRARVDSLFAIPSGAAVFGRGAVMPGGPPPPVIPDSLLIGRPYRYSFAPDLVYAAGDFDTVFGVQALARMQVSDVLGVHRFAFASNLVLDLRNADYVVSYAHLPGRTDFLAQAFHLARELTDQSGGTVYRYRSFGVSAGTRYPLDKFRRVEGQLGVIGVSLLDLARPGLEARGRTFLYPNVSYIEDTTTPGMLSAVAGRRFAAQVSGSPGPEARFATLLVDARQYVRLGGSRFSTVLGLRASGGISLGPDPQRFYAAGVDNWVNASFGSLPVQSPDEFVFATPVLPLRGFGFNEASGDRFALINAELRVPLFAAILPGPLPLLPLYDLQGVGFIDAGLISDGAVELTREIDDERVLQDLRLGAGVGLRTLLLGIPVRVDWAWPYDGRRFGETAIYFSLGLDF
ncbi:DPP IV N-terminal domain-containing protein [soil metagenome]